MKTKAKKFASKLFIAVLAFSHAVFLLPTISVSAQTNSLSNDFPTSVKLEFINPPTSAIQIQKTVTLTVRASAPVDKVNILYKPSDSTATEYKILGTAIKQENAGTAVNVYTYNYNTTLARNGSYKLKAQTLFNGAIYSSPEIIINVLNPIEINIINSTGSNISGLASLSAKVSNDVERVEFYYKPSNNIISEKLLLGIGIKDASSNYIYNYIWKTNVIKNGNYIITARALKDGTYFWSNEAVLNVNNAYEIGLIAPANNSKQSGNIDLIAKTDLPNDLLQGETAVFKIYNSNNVLIKNIISIYENGVYSASLNTEEMQNGRYKIFADIKTISADGALKAYKSAEYYFVIENFIDYKINISSPENNKTIFGAVTILVSTTIEVDGVLINLFKQGAALPLKELSVEHVSGSREYSASFDSNKLLNGAYIVKARSLLLKNPLEFREKEAVAYITVKNDIVDDDNIATSSPIVFPITATTSPVETLPENIGEIGIPENTQGATSSIKLPIQKLPELSIIYPKENQVVKNTIILTALSKGSVISVDYLLFGDGVEKKHLGKLRNINEWYLPLDSTILKDGYYVVKAVGWDNANSKAESNAVKIYVKNNLENTTEIPPITPVIPENNDTTSANPNMRGDDLKNNNTNTNEEIIKPLISTSSEDNLSTEAEKTIKSGDNAASSDIGTRKLCGNLKINSKAECDKYFEEKYLARECKEAGIKTRLECEKYTYNKYADKNCLSAGISGRNECRNFLSEKYSDKIQCEKNAEGFCKEAIKEKYLGDIVIKQQKFDELKERTLDIIGKPTTLKELESSLDVSKDIIPLAEKETEVKIIAVKSEIKIDENNNLIQTAPVALVIDSDKDGLSDDMEKRIGTDPKNFDSDNDGFSDGEEVKNGYNPIGAGKLGEKLAPIEEAIIQNKIIEQPKTTGSVAENFSVDKVSSAGVKEETKNNYFISGKAIPDTVLTLYIYSDLPVIATVRTDEYGNWNYEFNKTLIDGEHEVYVALNDNTGKIIDKSEPLSFFIKEAKAVSVKDFVSAKAIGQPAESEKILNVYVYFAIAAIIFGVLIFVYFLLLKRKNREFKF